MKQEEQKPFQPKSTKAPKKPYPEKPIRTHPPFQTHPEQERKRKNSKTQITKSFTNLRINPKPRETITHQTHPHKPEPTQQSIKLKSEKYPSTHFFFRTQIHLPKLHLWLEFTPKKSNYKGPRCRKTR